MLKILLVEDEAAVADFMKTGLQEEGFQVRHETDGLDGLQAAYEQPFDLIILDIILPRKNGLEICKRLHEQREFNTPVLMLTALGTTDDVVTGLDAGADDYLVKPFQFKELLARIRALTRRKNLLAPEKKIRIANLEIDQIGKKVMRDADEIKLTAREFTLLEYLMKNKGRVVNRNEILENVWDLNFDPGTNVVDVYVNYLRNKVDKNYTPKLIHTIVGMGYVVREE